MIQDMLSTDRFRWSLGPTKMVESEEFLSIAWDSLPPSKCGACDGMQGAMLNIAQYVTYPEPPPACEEQTVFPKCVTFIFTFYQLKSKRYLFVEASYVTLEDQQLVTDLKECGGGGKTSALTAISQLLFWKQTAESYNLIGKPFQLAPPPKTIAADPSLCEDGEPPDPPPTKRPLPGFPQFTIDDVKTVTASFYPVLINKYSGPNGSSTNEALFSKGKDGFDLTNFASTIGVSSTTSSRNSFCKVSYSGVNRRIAFTRANDNGGRSDQIGVAASTVGYVEWRNPDGTRASAPCGVVKYSFSVVLRTTFAPGTPPVDIEFYSAEAPDVVPDPPPPTAPPPPPPPPPQCRRMRVEVVLSAFAIGEYGGFDSSAMIAIRIKDETICALSPPPKPVLSELSNFFGTTYRLIGYDQKVTDLGECPCPQSGV
jgi:hypothetical protein